MKLVITPKIESGLIANYEISIINFAKALNRSIRQSDLAARIGRYEFLLAVNTDEQVPPEISGRIFALWRDEEFTFSYSSAQYIEGDRALSLLTRLDSSKVHAL